MCRACEEFRKFNPTLYHKDSRLLSGKLNAVSRLAWFSPDASSRSGIAAYSAELLPLLVTRGYTVDMFGAGNAHDFVWMQRRRPYDVTVFQMGNAACHDYAWGYIFRYPGLVVLHDAQLHQARALGLTKRWPPRVSDYVAEFRANHPHTPADVADVVAAGYGTTLYHLWPHIRLVIETARLTVVHNRRLLDDLRQRYPSAALDAIDMGVADPLDRSDDLRRAAEDVRERHSIPHDAFVLAAFGGITPEKRIAKLLRATSTLAGRYPALHLLLVGSPAEHYDVTADSARWGVSERVHVTGYVTDEELPRYLAAADVCACLRWPTNRETSASWLRCLAAARPTLISDLADLGDVPSLDPRGWRVLDTSSPHRTPVAVAIDLIDEDHSLHLALDRLIADEALRARIGDAARRWWQTYHRLDHMADGYERVIEAAITLPPPRATLPAHLTDTTADLGRALAQSVGALDRARDVLGA